MLILLFVNLCYENVGKFCCGFLQKEKALPKEGFSAIAILSEMSCVSAEIVDLARGYAENIIGVRRLKVAILYVYDRIRLFA